MLQASLFDNLSFDPYSFEQDCLAASGVDIGGNEVVEALMIPPVVIVLDEGGDRPFEINGQKVVFQQDAAFQVGQILH